MKTGTKHQNKTTGGEKNRRKREKCKYKQNQEFRENKYWKTISFSIFMPKLTEHNSTNQDPYSNQNCLSKYRNLKEIQFVKLKMSKKFIETFSEYELKTYKGVSILLANYK
uniref:Uncharacterized protein n=1 Tax=Prolemur simus TaxID=1328070 RepID=A0A8C8ZF14_PROSS